MAEVIMAVAMGLIFLGMSAGIVRLIAGERLVDRVIAVDLLTITAISILVLLAHFAERFIYVDVAIVYGLLSFLGVLAVGRYLEKGL